CLVERRLGYGGRPSRSCGRSERGTQQRARGQCATIVELVEIAILRNAVGPEIEFFDQAQMLGQVQCRFEIYHVRDAVCSSCPSTGKGEGVAGGDQAAERLVQWCVGSRGTIGERAEQLQLPEVIAAQADALGGRRSAD